MQGTRPLGLRSVYGGFFTSSGSTNRFSYGRLSSSRIIAHFQGFVPNSFDFRETASMVSALYDVIRAATYDVCIEQWASWCMH